MGDKKKEQARLRVQRYRNKKKEDVTQGNVTQDVTQEMFEGKPRYLTLSDGQLWDRKATSQIKPNKHLSGMVACNRANRTDLSRGRSKARRIALIGQALEKEMTGLDGKRLRLNSLVRLGVSGWTFAEIKDKINT